MLKIWILPLKEKFRLISEAKYLVFIKSHFNNISSSFCELSLFVTPYYIAIFRFFLHFL